MISLWMRWGGAIASLSFLSSSLMVTPVLAAPLQNWEFDPSRNELTVTGSDRLTPRYFVLENPLRIVLELPDTQVGDVSTEQTYTGIIQQIRVAQFQPNLTRITLELTPETQLAANPIQFQQAPIGGGLAQWVLRLTTSSTATANLASNPATFPQPTPTVNTPPLPPPTFWRGNQPSVRVPPLGGEISSSRQGSSLNQAANSTIVPVNPTPINRGAANLVTQPASLLNRGLPSLPPVMVPSPNQPPASTNAPPVSSPTPEPARSLSSLPPVRVPNLNQPLASTPQPPASTPASPIVSPPPQPAPETLISATVPVIAFGQPLPQTGSQGTVAINSDTVQGVTMRYPGEQPINLSPGIPHQEVLVLVEALRDRNSSVIAPMGTTVIGRFETNHQGSRFIVQAITLNGENILLQGESDWFTAPLQPGQIFQVRLRQP